MISLAYRVRIVKAFEQSVALKFLLFIFMTASITAGSVFGQCGSDVSPDSIGKIVKTMTFDQKIASEVELRIKASTPAASWKKNGSEAAVLSVFIDGKYGQDVIMFAGSKAFEYSALLGMIDAGKHSVQLVLNQKRSAMNTRNISVHSARTIPLAVKDPIDRLAIANSPILYVRPDAVDKFSDIPLLTYHEVVASSPNAGSIRYTTVFTNEDGGTQTAALMARWGRATDIEWVTEFEYKDGKIIRETYQAANHETKLFEGERIFGSHPLLLTATVNNNFADRGCSDLRIATVPFRADLSNRTRETVMDDHPWTHRIMAEEAFREGRIDAARMGANVIDDPRNYFYFDIFTENTDTAVSIEVSMFEGGNSSSDNGDSRLRVSKSGDQRIAVRKPAGRNLAEIRLRCHALSGKLEGTCKDARIQKMITLDDNFVPRVSSSEPVKKLLLPGESLIWTPPL